MSGVTVYCQKSICDTLLLLRLECVGGRAGSVTSRSIINGPVRGGGGGGMRVEGGGGTWRVI